MHALFAAVFAAVLGSAVRPPKELHSEERARADARVLARLLSPDQRERYTGTRDEAAARDALAAERLAALRSVASLWATPEEEATAARQGPGLRVIAALSALLRVGTLAGGLVFLGAFLAAPFGGDAFILLSAAGLAVGTVCLTGEKLLGAVADRTRVRPLLDWASHRPGQLGRGLPGTTRVRTVAGALDLVVWCLLVIVVGLGVTFLAVAVVVLAIDLFFAVVDGVAPTELRFAAIMAGLGLVTVAVAWLCAAGWSWLARSEVRRASAVQWLVEG